MFFPFLLLLIVLSLGRGERIAGIDDDGLNGLLSSMLQLTYYLPPMRRIIYETYRLGLDNRIVHGLSCAFVDLQASRTSSIRLENDFKAEVHKALDKFRIQDPEALLRWLIEAINIEEIRKMFGVSQIVMRHDNASDTPKQLYTLPLETDLRPRAAGATGERMEYQLKRFIPVYLSTPSEMSSIDDQLTLLNQTYVLVGFIYQDPRSNRYISVLRTNMEHRNHSWHQFSDTHVVFLNPNEPFTHRDNIKLLLYVTLSEADEWKLASYLPRLPPGLLDRHLSKKFGTDYTLTWILIIAGAFVVLLTLAIFIFIS